MWAWEGSVLTLARGEWLVPLSCGCARELAVSILQDPAIVTLHLRQGDTISEDHMIAHGVSCDSHMS